MAEILLWISPPKCVSYCLMIDSLFTSDHYVDFPSCIIMDTRDLSTVLSTIGFSNAKIAFKCRSSAVFFYLIFLDLKGRSSLPLGPFTCKSDRLIAGPYFFVS